MEGIKKNLKKILTSYRKLPDKKQYIEFFTALLSVPVLLTVILINLNNLNPKKVAPLPNQNKTIIVSLPPLNQPTTTRSSTSQATPTQCNRNLDPVTIGSPSENETVTENPVSVIISYDQQDYCAVVWSYRINGGSWSDYGNDSLSLYNLPQGQIKLELRVKSVVTGQNSVITRNFIYKGSATAIPVTASPTPATGSASFQ